MMNDDQVYRNRTRNAFTVMGLALLGTFLFGVFIAAMSSLTSSKAEASTAEEIRSRQTTDRLIRAEERQAEALEQILKELREHHR